MDEDPQPKPVKKNTTKKVSSNNEWKMFWSALFGNDESLADLGSPNELLVSKLKGVHDFIELLPADRLEKLSLDSIRRLTKSLSQERRALNLQIEGIRKEIELRSQRIDTLKLVGGESEPTQQEILQLNENGRRIQIELNDISDKLKHARLIEDHIKLANVPEKPLKRRAKQE